MDTSALGFERGFGRGGGLVRPALARGVGVTAAEASAAPAWMADGSAGRRAAPRTIRTFARRFSPKKACGTCLAFAHYPNGTKTSIEPKIIRPSRVDVPTLLSAAATPRDALGPYELTP